MSWDITIGSYRLTMMESVKITRSVELLSDTANIVLPGTYCNKTLNIEKQISRGDKVIIDLGYNGNLVREFDGYVQDIATDGGSITLICEDAIFQFRKSLANRVIKGEDVKAILQAVIKELGLNIGLSCDYSFKYDKFVFSNATGYDILKKIQEETKANIYMKGDVLHIHPQYAETFGDVAYDFAVNIDEEGTDLKYKRASDRKVMVLVEYTGTDGKQKKYEHGDTGGEKITIKPGTSDLASLKNAAIQEHNSRVYDGYEGNITSWLIPFCDAGYKASLKDADYEYKDGTYYVTEVVVEMSKEGGKRQVKLGKKIA